MKNRESAIADSITSSLTHHASLRKHRGCFPSLTSYLSLYHLSFHRIRPDLFSNLHETWSLAEESYLSNFILPPSSSPSSEQTPLTPLGDMGYSGSTFFRTTSPPHTLLIKSIPRRFENSFFRDDLLAPYHAHMRSHGARTLLIRIYDFLENDHPSLGTLVGTAPTHHIVMENLKSFEGGEGEEEAGKKVESWDLKPMSYFFPERDVANGALATEATKSKLPDEFLDKIILSRRQKERLMGMLEDDTRLLAERNAVDYSLFLVRVQRAGNEGLEGEDGEESWRTGVRSADKEGRYLYRAGILDFFWAKHKVHAKAMSGLIKGYNVIDQQGDMSITAEPHEYRERWLNMVRDLIEVV